VRRGRGVDQGDAQTKVNPDVRIRLDDDPTSRTYIDVMRCMALLAFMIVALSARAQPGAISGTVYDSLSGGMLTGAVVRVDSTNLSGTTDTSGQFVIGAVLPGPHRVTVSHPSLDLLELTVHTSAFNVRANTMVRLSLATPSQAAIFALYCRTPSPVTLVSGRVSRADGDDPVGNATVVASWTQPRSEGRTTRTDSVGRYHVCIPPGVETVIRAVQDAQATSYVPPSAAGLFLAIDLRLPRANDSSHATLSGRVQAADSGEPIKGATVSFYDAPDTATTHDDGRFQMTGLPTGSHVMIVRSVGFNAVALPMDLSARATRPVTISMRRAPPTLATGNTAAGPELIPSTYQRIGFAQRKRAGIGRFLTEDDIRRRSASTTGDLLNGLTGVAVGDNDTHGAMEPTISGRETSPSNPTRACTLYAVDGQVLGGADYTPGLPAPSQLIGIEVYRQDEPKPIAPPADAAHCTEVLIWTRAMLQK
jgi:Carboxypeptidase regulatory-like domain